MKTIHFTAALFPMLAMAAMAQAPFQAPALLIKEDGTGQRAWLTSATKAQLNYRETAVATEIKNARVLDFKTIYLFEPREFAEAMDLYQARNYQEALKRFSAIKERFKPIYSVENSHAALAAYYELECLRKLGDLEGLSSALQQFDKSPLTRDTQLRQLELYVLWDALRTKDWATLEELARERSKTRLPSDQRAQVAYLHGMALEGLEKPDQALFAYQTAMTSDVGASEDIARQSALRVLAILKEDPDLKRAIRDWGTPKENKNSAGYTKLMEASAIARMFEQWLGAGTALPAEYKDFLKYEPKDNAKPAGTEAAPDAKPAADDKAANNAKPAATNKPGK